MILKSNLKQFFCNFIAHSRQPCTKKDFNGKRDIACVCNAQHCDTLDPLKKTPTGVVTVFESSQSGDRFAETALKFGDNHKDNAKQSQTLTINKSQKGQKIIGFGAAFTDSTGY